MVLVPPNCPNQRQHGSIIAEQGKIHSTSRVQSRKITRLYDADWPNDCAAINEQAERSIFDIKENNDPQISLMAQI
jgi:hypothetical protein